MANQPKPIPARTAEVHIRELITDGLRAHGYDGLWNGEADNCGCGIGDIAPCGEIDILGCVAARLVPCDGTCDTGKCDNHYYPVKRTPRPIYVPGSVLAGQVVAERPAASERAASIGDPFAVLERAPGSRDESSGLLMTGVAFVIAVLALAGLFYFVSVLVAEMFGGA
jgi:hypothetical protein